VPNPLRFENGIWKMDFDDLKKKIDHRTRMLILCSPHNPVGRVWRRKELEELAEICLKHDLLIISDEIHAEHVYRGHRHIPTASLSPEIAARTITLTAPSKAFNIAGLTTSVVIVPNQRLLNLYKPSWKIWGLRSITFLDWSLWRLPTLMGQTGWMNWWPISKTTWILPGNTLKNISRGLNS